MPGPDLRREVALTRVAIAVTVIATFASIVVILQPLLCGAGAGSPAALLERLFFLLIVLFLIYGGWVYQLTRLAYLRRMLAHRRVPDGELLRVYEGGSAPALAILVPSYREEPDVVRKTLLSAALQEYPNRRVVLLIDDPPEPTAPDDIKRLVAARQLPTAIRKMLQGPRDRCDAALARFRARRARGAVNRRAELRKLAALHREVGEWFLRQGRRHPTVDHVDRLFGELTFHRPGRRCLEEAEAFAARSSVRSLPTEDEIAIAYWRLAARFRVEITTFERKRYANLSQEPNKAMNLNSYLGVMGRRVREMWTTDGQRLLGDGEADKRGAEVPDADYVLMVDADSILDPEYALRLLHVMEEPGNERLAVAQTPYSAFPGAPGLLERIAGATTDVQHIIHQGFTQFGATFWVGANAIARKRALEDIGELTVERGYPVWKFIQDRTVIEDTESSVDLVARGWQLYNYPERLAFSATPPDFGALLIQRRRWANGGLLILPKLFRYLARHAVPGRAIIEGVIRCHYLISITAANIGLLLVLAVPFGDRVETLWLPLTAVPYYVLYARDLQRNGYRPSDLARVYALNLMLIPVNLAGVFRSLHQAWTGRRSAFGRTPKIKGRTSAPRRYLMAEHALLAQWLLGAVVELLHHHQLHAVFALANAAFLFYAIVRFIGLPELRRAGSPTLRWLRWGEPSKRRSARWAEA